MRYEVPYRLILGERSNGKTYSVKKRCIEKFKNYKEKFLYVRKRSDSISRKEMKKLFADINDDFVMDWLSDFVKYTTDSGFYIENDSGERSILGYAISVEDYESKKGIPYNDITTIFFDEFIEKRGDIDDEVGKFLNLVSTVRRKRDNVEVFMVANTITRFSPYFEEFGIDIKKLKRGECHYIKHENGAELAIEYCGSLNIQKGVKQQDRYFGFDHSPASQMIMYGEWEYDIVNIKNIDGIGWKEHRRLIPLYFTALATVYELSIYIKKNPVAFVRTINTQNGFVKDYIEYNLSYDNSLQLFNKNGIVPSYKLISPLMTDEVNHLLKIFNQCIDCGRIVFDNISSGSDFLRTYKEMI